MKLTKEFWGNYEGKEVYLFKLSSDKMEVQLSNFGATITGIFIPDKNGERGNIVLRHNTLSDYITDEYYMGCTVGRFAGRIAGAQLLINDTVYPLVANDHGKNIHLHGGYKGFNKQAFTTTEETAEDDTASVTFHYQSPHLEEGYPGNLDVFVTFELTADNKLSIKYRAVTDKDTHINLTNHSYFNLSGKPQSALNSRLFINADNYVVTDKNYIPTGAIEPVEGTPYDFKIRRPISNEYYNECLVLNKADGRPSATLSDDSTGREIVLETDMPSLLFYSGDYLGGKFLKNSGVCLETQFFPDTPNHKNFPTTLLKAGKQWESYTNFTFNW